MTAGTLPRRGRMACRSESWAPATSEETPRGCSPAPGTTCGSPTRAVPSRCGAGRRDRRERPGQRAPGRGRPERRRADRRAVDQARRSARRDRGLGRQDRHRRDEPVHRGLRDRGPRPKTSSEFTRALVPGARVVKAFNTIFYKRLAGRRQAEGQQGPPGDPGRLRRRRREAGRDGPHRRDRLRPGRHRRAGRRRPQAAARLADLQRAARRRRDEHAQLAERSAPRSRPVIRPMRRSVAPLSTRQPVESSVSVGPAQRRASGSAAGCRRGGPAGGGCGGTGRCERAARRAVDQREMRHQQPRISLFAFSAVSSTR